MTGGESVLRDQGRFLGRAVPWGLLLCMLLAVGDCIRASLSAPVPAVGSGVGLAAVIGLVAVWGSWVLHRTGEPVSGRSLAAGGIILFIGTAWLTTLVPVPWLSSYLAWACVLLLAGLGLTVTAAIAHNERIPLTEKGLDAESRPDLASSETGLRSELSMLTPERSTLNPPPVLQSWTRLLTDEGELLEGSMRVGFAPGERIVRRHVPISPPFSDWPRGWCECDDGETFEAELDAVRSYGVRLTIRRRGDVSDPAETEVNVVLQSAQAVRRVA
jgi:hypothetical protein